MRLLLLALALTPAAAQWQIQPSNTTASLRGIHAVTDQIAWASGTAGTVLHTTDGGQHWLPCTTPPQAEHLDFRGIQAFDANTAIVMSSGKGDLSRLYETTNACQTWTLVFTNPDPEGFWDALQFGMFCTGPCREGFLLGDPVEGRFAMFITEDFGDTWRKWGIKGSGWKGNPCGERDLRANNQEALFAASNQSLTFKSSRSFLFVSGGKSGARLFLSDYSEWDGPPCSTNFISETVPSNHHSASAGAFAIAGSSWADDWLPKNLVIATGDYTEPDAPADIIVFMTRSGFHVPFSSYFERPQHATTPPHGYRSAVAYAPTQKAWITVGPNGTDLSTDDGRNWHPLRPAASGTPDEDKSWNALSLPFVVGPNGRIGRLRPNALP